MIDKNKTVCVTGADGFIGSHLTQMLLRDGYKVRALAQYNSPNNWGWLEDVLNECPECASRLEVVTGDVRDANFCRGAYKGLRHGFSSRCIDCHSVQLCGSRQLRGHQHQGTLNMCQAARDEGTDRLIVTSTSEVYGTASICSYSETHPRQPQSPYSCY